MKFDVRFVVNRYPLNMQHRALEIVKESGETFWRELLFPEVKVPPRDRFEKLRYFNRSIEQNKEQALAVPMLYIQVFFEYKRQKYS
jgi:hypothetical protein